MVRAPTALTIGLALLLVVPAMAGCLGSSSSSSSTGDEQDPSSENATPDPSTGDSGSDDGTSSGNGSEDGYGESGGSNATADNGTQKKTFTNSTTVPAGAHIVFVEFPADAAASWSLFDEPPEDYTGILVEFTWETETKGTPAGGLVGEVKSSGGDYQNTSQGQSGPVRIWTTPRNYSSRGLSAHVRPMPPAGLWANAQITVHTTYFWGGAPDWGYSAAG